MEDKHRTVEKKENLVVDLSGRQDRQMDHDCSEAQPKITCRRKFTSSASTSDTADDLLEKLQAIQKNPILNKRQKDKKMGKLRNKASKPTYDHIHNGRVKDQAQIPATDAIVLISPSSPPTNEANSSSTSVTTPEVKSLPSPPSSMSMQSCTSPPAKSIMPTTPRTSMPAVGTSTSWVSKSSQTKDKFERLQKTARHLGFSNSPFFPQNVMEYNKVTYDTMREKLDVEQKKLDAMEESQKWKGTIRPIFCVGKTEENTISAPMIKYVPYTNLHDSYIKNVDDRFKAEQPRSTTEFLQNWDPSRPEINRVELEMLRGGIDKTTIWNESYEDRPEERGAKGPEWGVTTRARWPGREELKAEGDTRARIFNERRMPIPNLDEYSEEAARSKLLAGSTPDDLVRSSGKDIHWFERKPFDFKGVDYLGCIGEERHSLKKTWTYKGVDTALPGRGGRHSAPNKSISANDNSSSKGSISTNGSSAPSSQAYAMNELCEDFTAISKLASKPSWDSGYHGSVKDLRTPSGSRLRAESKAFTPSTDPRLRSTDTCSDTTTGGRHPIHGCGDYKAALPQAVDIETRNRRAGALTDRPLIKLGNFGAAPADLQLELSEQIAAINARIAESKGSISSDHSRVQGSENGRSVRAASTSHTSPSGPSHGRFVDKNWMVHPASTIYTPTATNDRVRSHASQSGMSGRSASYFTMEEVYLRQHGWGSFLDEL